MVGVTATQVLQLGDIEEFPNRRPPFRKMFDNIDRRLRETGTFYKTNLNPGRQRFARNVCKCRRANIKQSLGRSYVEYEMVSIWRILHEQSLYPFHAVKVQELLPTDFQKRLEFCRSMLQKHRDDPLFFKRIIFTDESCFTKCGIFNLRNHHEWADANPRATVASHSQFRFKINN
ncbi:hypothetical protein NQ318_011997 [Aromia moschata]|uniref:Transposase n=1 Tax=Aromia moschata TaxID=1265417 RepID=A0AAV8XIG2_9CUCU|nr:hypothetical protein NQ318_011997 [Aromia moschata]